MAKRKAKRTNNFPKILIVLGLSLFFLSIFTQSQTYFRLLMTQKERPVTVSSAQTPVLLSIPTQKINVNVDEGGIVQGEWVLSRSNALYLPSSGKLGEGYNTIIYAHNTPLLFGNLANLKKSDKIIVKDKAGKSYAYKIVSVEQVDPKNLKALYSTQKNVLTLFTCSGWADTQRTVVRGILTK
jgi:LPXTG-site transpeptidase (sortase) family protein